MSSIGGEIQSSGSSGVIEHLWKRAAQHQSAAHPPECAFSDCSLKLCLVSSTMQNKQGQGVLPTSAPMLLQLYPLVKSNLK